MATGYILKPTGRKNPSRRGVTLVNPHRGSVLPRATGRERSSVTSWGSNARKSRRNGASKTGRIVEVGKSQKKQSSTQSMSGRLVPNKKAGSYARKGKGASRKSVKSGTKRKRLQSRNPARKTKQVAKKTTRTGRFVKVPAKKVRGKVVRKAYSYKKPKRSKTTRRKMTRNAIPRWEVSVHPGTGKRGIKGTKMSLADRAKWTKRGVLRAGIGRFVKKGKKVQTGVRGKAGAGHWKKGVVHPVSGRTVGGQVMSARDKALFKSDGTTRKGVGPAAVRAAYGKGSAPKPKKKVAAKKATPAKRKTVTKKKTAAKRKTRGKRYRVKKPSGGTYLRKYPTKRRKPAKRKTAARRGKYVTVKVPAKRSRSGKIVRKAYSYKRKATAKRKPAKRTYKRKTATKRKTRRYRVCKPGGGTYLRKYPTKRRKPAKRKTTKRRTARRYRVKKPGGGTYLRKYPRRRAKGRKKAYTRKRANGRRRGKTVRVKGYTRSDGVRVKGYSYKLKKTGSRKGRIARNPYKRKKVSRKGYTYTRKRPTRRRVSVPKSKRRQWYPHHYGGRWITNKKAASLGLLNKHEKRAFWRNGGSAAMVTNPAALAMLPSSEQLVSVGKAAGLGFVGFGAAVAAGRALNNVTMLSQYTGAWTSVVGNVAAGLGFWAVASYLDDDRLNAMKPFVAAGAGLAAIVNTMLNLIGRGIVPDRYAAWVFPGAGSVAAAPELAVEPENGNGNGTGFGQIDIYEAALDGVGGIEEELEMELDRLSGDGIFDSGAKAGIFSGLDGTGTPVEEAYAGMGAQVEEAYAGMNEYLEVPMSEYLEVPMSGMGAQVEEAYAGMNEYLEVPMSEYLEVPMSGMGQSPAAVESSLRNRPLMPGFKNAVQTMVRQRIASGKPMDNAFYQRLGQAAASLARKKFDQRVGQVGGRPGHLPMEPWKAPLLRTSAPMYKKQVGTPPMAPGTAEPIPAQGPGNEGIFADGEDDGIF